MTSRTSSCTAARLAAAAAVLAAALAAPPPALALLDCLAKGTCQTPVRCELLRQRAMWRQLRDLYRSPTVSASLKKASLAEATAAAKAEYGANPPASAISSKALDIYQEKMRELAQDGKTILLPDCGSDLVDPPSFGVGTDCYLRAFVGSRDAAGKVQTRKVSDADIEGMNTCRETVDAARAHEKEHQKRCCDASCQPGCSEKQCEETRKRLREGKPGPSEIKTLDELIREEIHGYATAINALNAEISQRRKRCSTADAAFDTAMNDLKQKASKLARTKPAAKPGGVR